MSLCPAFRDHVRSLWHQFFGTIALMEFVLKNLCQQLCSFSLAPCQRSYACPMARDNRIDGICPENTCQQLCILSKSFPPKGALPKLFPTVSFPFMMLSLPSRSLPTELSPSCFPRLPFPFMMSSLQSRSLPTKSPQAVSHGFLSVHDVVASVSLPPNGALPKLFPTVSFPFMMLSLPSRSTRGKVN